MPTQKQQLDALLDRWNESRGAERMPLLLEYIKLKESLAEQQRSESAST